MVTANNKSKFITILMLSVLFFQISVIPDTLNIKIIARLVNTLMLCYFFLMAIIMLKDHKSKNIFLLFIFPCLLIILGYVINFSMALSFDALGQAGKLIPWLALLVVPVLIGNNLEQSWHLFYKFVLWVTIVSLLEYVAIFSGLLSPTMIETNRGVFFKGIFSILHYLEGGFVYYRFYGVFQEPGTAAMFMIPAIVYSLVYSRWLSLCLFLIAFALTLSLGGIVSLCVSLVIFFFWKFASKSGYSLFAKIFFLIFTVSSVVYLSGDFIEQYQSKQDSATVREDNVTKFVENFGQMVLKNPFGFVLEGDSLTALAEGDDEYVGSNFTFYVAFAQGGFISFIGYTMFFLANCLFLINAFFKKHNENKIYACVIISLPAMLLFCFQRTTILESALYSFLYGSVIMHYFIVWMSKNSKKLLSN